ncbi:hydroxypyruvate isomerase family protein [Pseudobacter ginsenosidimutans]|uniref:Hydroxypyruvate isomerase n=1 Tax=Pseudobacter ginsenosidimutans TaxID=661488 RepID=A0A4Q7MSV2_9BACT|nr:TIM barrel protein [Pseudobacter ginsenosidimutans]QEC41341.1 TIM barrel protein [Pseudobacter ginsenosidimutans]RZS71885.1 hydroxypyruvate isomerase [Pseudobacter ginsenosidimutans]
MTNHSRRLAIKNLVAGTAAVGTAGMLSSFTSTSDNQQTLKGKINHSVCRWCFGSVPLEEFAAAVKKMGIYAIDLVGPKDWPTLQKHGIFSSMCNGAEINLVDGFNDPQFHATLVKNYTEMIPLVAKAGYKNLICFSGNARGKDAETGWNNSVAGLKQIIGLAEKHNVTLVMELLNSKIDHKDYQCDKTSWGVELAKRVGSENFKLLYDIYHMQIDEGDVIRTIRDNHQYITHYHTAGVPGRHEIDEKQELNYPAIMQAIVDTGFKGYVAQEFIPSSKVNEEKLAALQKAIQICDI